MSKLARYALSPQLMMPWHPGVTISTAKAAKYLGCCSKTIIRMIEDGQLEGYKMRPNRKSAYVIIRDSVLRVAEEWRREAGVADRERGRALVGTVATVASRRTP